MSQGDGDQQIHLDLEEPGRARRLEWKRRRQELLIRQPADMDGQEGQKWLREMELTWERFGQHGLRGGMPKKNKALRSNGGGVDAKVVVNARQRSIFPECQDKREYQVQVALRRGSNSATGCQKSSFLMIRKSSDVSIL